MTERTYGKPKFTLAEITGEDGNGIASSATISLDMAAHIRELQAEVNKLTEEKSDLSRDLLDALNFNDKLKEDRREFGILVAEAVGLAMNQDMLGAEGGYEGIVEQELAK